MTSTPANSTYIRPTLEHETAAWRDGRVVVGVDEAGRGALAGPVVAGAVAFDPCFSGAADLSSGCPRSLDAVRDSKLTSPAERPQLAENVCRAAVAWAVGEASALEIDALGIARAGEIAMLRALKGLGLRFDLVLVDGFRIRTLRGVEQRGIVRGDQTVFSIAAASLIAKVHRDSALIRLACERAEYGFDRHKGYGSPEHLRALALHGPAVEHRLSWAPVRGYIVRTCDSPLRSLAVGQASDSATPPLEVGRSYDSLSRPLDVGPDIDASVRQVELGPGSDRSHRQLELPPASVPARPTTSRTNISIPAAPSASQA